MKGTSQRLTKLITDHHIANGLLLTYENEARILLQREIDSEPDYLITLLGETIRNDIEEYIPECKEVYSGLIMEALDQVDFDLLATPFINDAIEDKRYRIDIEKTNESINKEITCLI